MKLMMKSAAFSLIVLVSACASDKTFPVAVSDYCTIAKRIELKDLAPRGVVPVLNSDGWASQSVLTRDDAELLAAEAKKYDERCISKK